MAESDVHNLSLDGMLPLDDNTVKAVLSQFKQRSSNPGNVGSEEWIKQLALKNMWQNMHEDPQLKV